MSVMVSRELTQHFSSVWKNLLALSSYIMYFRISFCVGLLASEELWLLSVRRRRIFRQAFRVCKEGMLIMSSPMVATALSSTMSTWIFLNTSEQEFCV
jgi:heme exporter protein D